MSRWRTDRRDCEYRARILDPEIAILKIITDDASAKTIIFEILSSSELVEWAIIENIISPENN